MWKYFNIHSVPQVTQTYSRYGIWAQVETDLIFTKEEKRIIEGIKKIVAKGDIDFLDFVLHSPEILYNAASILGIEGKVRTLLDILSIKSIVEIDMSVSTMLNYVDIDDFKRVYKIVERNIMEGKLENNKEAIIDYLKCL